MTNHELLDILETEVLREEKIAEFLIATEEKKTRKAALKERKEVTASLMEAFKTIREKYGIDTPEVPAEPPVTIPEGQVIAEPYYEPGRKGIVVPVPGGEPVLLDMWDLSTEEVNWEVGMRLAKKIGKRLPTKDEFWAISFWGEKINALLEKHGGKPMGGYYWSASEYSAYAWIVSFSSGHVTSYNKYGTNSVRAVVDYN